MSTKTVAVTGAVTGAAVAIILLSLESIGPFSPHTNAFIKRLTFRLCPLYILGFANGMGSMTVLVIVTILGNAVLYGLALALFAALLTFLQRKIA